LIPRQKLDLLAQLTRLLVVEVVILIVMEPWELRPVPKMAHAHFPSGEMRMNIDTHNVDTTRWNELACDLGAAVSSDHKVFGGWWDDE
jgi:hypothetical protein